MTSHYIISYYIILYILYYIYYCIYYTCILYIIYFKFYIICIYITLYWFYIMYFVYYIVYILYHVIYYIMLYIVLYTYAPPLPPIPPRCDQSMLWYCLERLLLFRMTLNLHVFAFSLKESATYLERRKHMIHMMLEKIFVPYKAFFKLAQHPSKEIPCLSNNKFILKKMHLYLEEGHLIIYLTRYFFPTNTFIQRVQHSLSKNSILFQ